MLVINGWALLAHPVCLDQIERLAAAVEPARSKDPAGWTQTAGAKLLAALQHLMFERVPADPGLPEFRQGDSFGPDRKHWFRAKFGNGRFRLFFRFSSSAKVIIYAWVNDQETLRTSGSKTDAYRPPGRSGTRHSVGSPPSGLSGTKRRRWRSCATGWYPACTRE